MATTKKTATKAEIVENVDAVAVEAPAKKTAKKTTTKATKATKATKKVAPKATVVENAVSTVEKAAEKAQADVTKVVNENVEKAQELAKQVWFAGLGVVGRSADELQAGYAKASDELKGRYTRLSESREELVKNLVNRGEKVQAEAEVILQESRTSVEERIETARTRFTEMVDISARLKEASDKLESLSKDLKKSA